MKPDSRAARPRRARRFLALICASTLSLPAAGCGKVGAPIPPARITERTSRLAAIQRGGDIILSWPAPALGSDASARSYVARADVYRLAERRDEEPVLDEDDYEEFAQVIGYLDRAAIEAQIKSRGRLEFTDAIDSANSLGLANTRLRYAIRYVNKRGQSAAFSNTIAVEPVPGIALPPASVAVTDQAQDAITISWKPPEANVDNSRPASVVGYNIYRRPANRATFGEPLNPEPITEPVFVDKNFQYQLDYVYTARSLSQGTSGLIESADSEPLAFKPIDTFAPAPPDPVTLASANVIISLVWPTSPERDVIGYNVYRAESADAVGGDWVKLNAQPLSTVTYRDDRVSPGKRYYYRVTAVDRFDNESEPSATVGETANP